MHEKFMKLALAESFKALPACLPNPPVGCILVSNEKVVAKGFTQEIGGMHAEAHALSKVKGDLRDVIAYVTLEPCSFHGRTPSCAKALIKRNIGSVYLSVRDPDQNNNGKGVQLLLDAGINVVEGTLSDDVSEFIREYLNTG